MSMSVRVPGVGVHKWSLRRHAAKVKKAGKLMQGSGSLGASISVEVRARGLWRWELLLMLAVWLGVAAAQQIVIEPTNGRPASSSTEKIRRPAAAKIEMGNNAKSVAQPTASQPKREVKARPEKKRTEKNEAAKSTPAAIAAPLMAKSEPPPTAKVYPSRPAWAIIDTRDNRSLQDEITGALARDPRLAASEIHVSVEDNSVVLDGHAAGRDERLEAERLTQSYAWNRKLVNKIELLPRVSARR
jgi:hypothetical protein